MDSKEVIGNGFLLKQLQTTVPVLAFYKSNSRTRFLVSFLGYA